MWTGMRFIRRAVATDAVMADRYHKRGSWTGQDGNRKPLAAPRVRLKSQRIVFILFCVWGHRYIFAGKSAFDVLPLTPHHFNNSLSLSWGNNTRSNYEDLYFTIPWFQNELQCQFVGTFNYNNQMQGQSCHYAMRGFNIYRVPQF